MQSTDTGWVIRPLPAHAGVSRSGSVLKAAAQAAPRPRGGQSAGEGVHRDRDGRSPPTRGSVVDTSDEPYPSVPLPAHAGVSRNLPQRARCARPAPRPRGGQSSLSPTNSLRSDRSPPTRGSVATYLNGHAVPAPLPAHAGVSRPRVHTLATSGSAPRPRGGQSSWR